MDTTKSETAPTISQVANRQRFKTYDGHCYVQKDKIVITHNRKMRLHQALNMSPWFYLKMGIFLISAVFSLAYACMEFASEELYVGTAYLFLGISFALLSKAEVVKLQVVVIDRHHIISVKYYASRFGRKHSFFEVVHLKDAAVATTAIFLPKPKNSGRPNTQKALELMDQLITRK